MAGSVCVRSCQHKAMGTAWLGTGPATSTKRPRCAAKNERGNVATRSVAAATAAAAPKVETVTSTRRSIPACAYAAVAGGALAAVGTLALFRHNSSFGGFGVVALDMQRTRGWRAGNILLAIDLVILLAAITLLSPEEVLWSTLCAVVLNMTVALNHRSDRYLVQ